MLRIALEQVAVWVVLAATIFAAVAAYKRWGVWSLIGVLALAWPALTVLDLLSFGPGARQIIALNPPSVLFRQLWPAATWTLAIVAVPTIFACRSRSSRRIVAWGLGGATFAAFGAPVVALFTALNVPRHDPCYLPSIESDVVIRAIDEVRTSSYFDDSCPVPIARELQLERDYGVIRMQWWGSPHRLYMVGETSAGRPLAFSGARVEDFRDGVGSFLAAYSSRVTFPTNDFDRTASSQVFELQVLDGERTPLEQLTLRYVPTRCTCASYDGP